MMQNSHAGVQLAGALDYRARAEAKRIFGCDRCEVASLSCQRVLKPIQLLLDSARTR